MAGGAAGLQQYLAAAAAAAAGGGGLNNALLGQVRVLVDSVVVFLTMLTRSEMHSVVRTLMQLSASSCRPDE
jgi:hypothetical protein